MRPFDAFVPARRSFGRASVALAIAAAGLLAVPAGPARAQAAITTVGLFSLLGDGVEITVNDSAPTDTRIARERRETLEFRQIGFDTIVAREVRAAFARELPGAQVVVFNLGAAFPSAEQRQIAQGAHDGALPEWMIKAVQERRLSHVLLVTRQRAEVQLRTAEGDSIGRGRADGIGFYLDPLFDIKNLSTGAMGRGALGPHAFVELTLMDTDSAKVVRATTIREQRLVGPRETKAETDPWNFLTPAERVLELRGALERGLRRVLPAFLQGR
jgi:hypothetical protein